MAVKPVSVSQLNGYIKRVLQTDPMLSGVSVRGEVSNIKYHESGHVYFSLKDHASKINCFLPSDRAAALRYELDDGMEVDASGYIYVYERGGTYSLNIKEIEISGQGSLLMAFEKLKEKLSKEGLFDPLRKKSLPGFPENIALVTSGSGAAVEDMLKIIRARNNIVNIMVYPVPVQGPGAAKEISEAIDDLNRRFPETDIIITGRGGGSAEELWAFNEEIVVRSIYNSKIPVISAVGHETDVTISDFAADVRAETPTAAAQLAVPDVFELRKRVSVLRERLTNDMDRYLNNKKRLLDMYNIAAFIKNFENRVDLLAARVNALKVQLDASNPMNIMAMGYGAILDGNGALTGSAAAFDPGDPLTAVFSDGQVHCTVKEIGGGGYGKGKADV